MHKDVKPSALQGVRVLELGGHLSTQFAARILGDFGAEVLKVEGPQGDATRQDGPYVPGAQHSALFEYLNWNKQSVVLEHDVAVEQSLETLLQAADILVYGCPVGVAATEVSMSPKQLHERYPHLAIVAVSDFGFEGPEAHWQGSDLVLQAMGGIMSFSGLQNREPLKPGLRQSVYCAGLNAAYTAMAAYFHQLRCGHGSLVDLSALEVVTSELVSVLPAYTLAGVVAARRSAVQDPLLSGEPLPVADGYVTLQVNPLYGPERFADLLNEPRLCDPRFASQQGRIDHAQELRELLHSALAHRSGRELFEKANEEGLLSGVLQSASQLMECSHLQERGLWQEIPATDGNGWKLPAKLATLSLTPVSVRQPAPALGSTRLSDALQSARDAMASRIVRAVDAQLLHPLQGIRVLDLSTVFAAPYMGALLADLGAEVIKVEAPKRLDQLRAGGFGYLVDNHPGEAGWNRCSTFQMLNRGKRSVVLDLQTSEGRDILCDLIKQTDVLIDNFTPRVMRGWGMSYEKLASINPRLVMLSNTGYGSSGPWAEFKAQGTTLEATMGLSAYAGYAGESATKVGQSYPDFLAAWSGLTSIMAALVYREKSGLGQWIDLGMYQLGPLIIPETFIAVQSGQADVGCLGNQEWNATFSGVFPAEGENQWLAISTRDMQTRAALCVVVGADESSGDDLLKAAVNSWSQARNAQSAAAHLQACGIAAGPVNDARDLLHEPQLRARKFFECIDFESDIGMRALIGRPYVWQGASVEIRRRAPFFGEDNHYVLRELLQLSEAAVHALYETKVVSDQPLNPPSLRPIDIAALVRLGTIKAHDHQYRDSSSLISNHYLEETTP